MGVATGVVWAEAEDTGGGRTTQSLSRYAPSDIESTHNEAQPIQRF